MEKRKLLQKYDIPVSHLDFEYVKKCKNTKELERIVAILRSGEEGYYPDLTKCAEDKLKELKPNSKALRTENRILTKNSLSSDEWKELNDPIFEWSDEIKNKDKLLTTIQKNNEKDLEIEVPPIRKSGKVMTKKVKDETQSTELTKVSNSRIAATNYNQWDKYDAEAEMLKMDLEKEREQERVERMNQINKEKSSTKEILEEDKSNIYDKLSLVEREKLAEDYKIRGNDYFKSKEYIFALENYSRCIEIQPSVAAYNNKAVTNLKLQRYSDALSDCTECLQRDPKNIKALLRKAEAFLGLGRKVDAYHTYDDVRAIDPNNITANKAIEKLRSELGDVAPLSATRIKIVEEKNNEEKPVLKSKPPQLKPKKIEKKPDYDLAELIKPNKLVKSNLLKTMENFGKLTSKNDKTPSMAGVGKAQKVKKGEPEINLFSEHLKPCVRNRNCLIEEL